MGRARYSGDVHTRKINWSAVVKVVLFLALLALGMWFLAKTDSLAWLGDLLNRV